MSRVGELCVRSTREVRSAAPSSYGGTSPNGCCFGFCPSDMVCVREREVYPNASIILTALDVALRVLGVRCPLPSPGLLFKLDIDSFWQAVDEVPEFDVDPILNQADALHEPVRDVFEILITDRLREEMLRRGRVVSLLAACDLITRYYLVEEVASWFEMPLSPSAPVAPITLYAADRADLVFEFASGHADPETLLPEFDSDWRERYRSEFEVFEAGDGDRSIRMRG